MADIGEILKSIGGKIMDVAPSLAGAILSPNPATVLAAFGAIKKAVGLSDNATEQEVDIALTGATPEQRLALTAENHRFQEEMGRQELEKIKAAISDIQNARGMHVETTKATGKRDLNLYVIAYTVLGGYLGMVAFLLAMLYMGKPIKDESGILFMLMGNLSTFAGMVLGYFYGTTKASGEKTDMIHNSTPLKPCD